MDKNPIIYLIKKLWKYSKGNRGNVVLYFFMFLIANGIDFLVPLVIARLLNVIQRDGITSSSMPQLIQYLGLYLLVNIGVWAFWGPARVIENKNAFLVRANYKKYLLDGTMAFPIDWHNNHHSGDTIDKIEKGTTNLFHFSEATFEIIQFVIMLVSSYIALTYFNLHSGYIVLFMVIVTMAVVIKFDKILVAQYKTLYGSENKISQKIYDVISNITTVVILRIEKLVSSAIFKKIMDPFKLYIKNNKINETKWFLVSMCGDLMVVLVLLSYFYSSLHSGSTILIGTAYALYGYVQRIRDLFFRFAYMYGDMVKQKAAVMNAEELAREFSEVKKSKQVKLEQGWKELSIDGLCFSYHTDEGADLHLDNVCLGIKKGARVALVGESGSGKTTLLKIIRELYKPGQVKVSLDGRELNGGFESISSDIALIPQDPEIFSTTIRENITVGVNHNEEYIKKFTDMACITGVIEGLPNKIDSYIYERGVNLSGGEKQRLALARGLMACEDKSIVLLDEPTSSVDTKNEIQIFQNIFKSFKGKTIVASVHRLHLLSLFDQIYYFNGGKLLASGTLEELLANSKQFKEIWEKYLLTGESNGKINPRSSNE